MRNKVLAALALAVFAFSFGPEAVVTGQDQDLRPSRTKAPEFQKHVAVNYMLVDVVVTDRRGDYVRNLTKDDFQLYVDGKPVEIDSMDEYSMLLPSAHQFELVEDIGSVEFVQPPRNIIIFFDLFYSSHRGIRRSIEAVEEFINNRIQPGDRVMVLTYHGALRTIQPFTNDKEQVVNALRAVGLSKDGSFMRLEAPESQEAVDKRDDDPLRDDELYEELMEIRRTMAGTELSFRQYAASKYLKILQGLARAVKAYPGRKTMIMLSEGLNMDDLLPAHSMNPDFQAAGRLDKELSAAVPSSLEDYTRMLELMNDSSTSFYTVNVGGLKPVSGAETLGHGFDQRAGLPGVVMESITTRRARQDFMSGIAIETGGKAYYNQNNVLDVLNSIEMDISNYYILGFRTGLNPEKSEYKKVKIRMKNREHRVVYRKGFRTPEPFMGMSKDERFMHLYEGFISMKEMNELQAVASFTANPVSPDAASVSICIETTGEDINAGAGEVEYELRAFNEIGGIGKIYSGIHKTYKISSADVESVREEGLRLVEALDLTAGENKIRVVLRNNQNGKRSYFFLNRIYRPLSQDILLLSNPVLYDPDAGRRSVDEHDLTTTQINNREDDNIKAGADMLVHPVHGKLFPKIEPVFGSGDVARFFVALSNLQLKPGEEPKLSVNFFISPVDDRGMTGDLQQLRVENPQFLPYRDAYRYMFSGEFGVDSFEPGRYAFIITVIDRNTDRRSRSSTEFTVVNE